VIYDIAASAFTEYAFSPVRDGMDVEVAPTLRRIYVLSSDNHLFILDMDTGQIYSETPISGSSLAIDEKAEMLFTGSMWSSPSSLYRYSVSGDVPLLVQSRWDAGGNGRKIGMSPDGKHIVLPCGGGNGLGYTLYDFDAANLDNVLGEWQIGTYPTNAVFSKDGNFLYGTNGDPYDNYLYVMDAGTYQQIRKIPFPNTDDYSVFTPNSTGSVIVGFSYDTYYNKSYALYFFPGAATP